jgi:SsrA-binding protein
VSEPDGRRVVAVNKRARFDYVLEETFEAGLSLTGSEVKSLRQGRANIAESYAAADGDEIAWLNAYIPEYAGANRFNHEPRRPRRVLLQRRQIDRLLGAVRREGRTIVPTRLYFNARGLAKLELALARGKTAPDKRAAEADRDWKREQGRLMRDKG